MSAASIRKGLRGSRELPRIPHSSSKRVGIAPLLVAPPTVSAPAVAPSPLGGAEL